MQYNRPKKRKTITIFGIKMPLRSWTIFFSVIVSVIGFFVIFNAATTENRPNINQGGSAGTTGEVAGQPTSQEDEPVSETPPLTELPWYLILVNHENTLPVDYSPPRALINTNFTRDGEAFYFHEWAVQNLVNMLYSAQRADEYMFVISSYRPASTQERLFNNQVQARMNEGMNREAAEVAAATRVARPGTSEHQSGLAVDLNSLNENFANTSRFRWLQENAHNYGFILRYDRHTQDITGVVFEPWHWRFVGVTHARIIREREITLEEYVAYLLGED